MAQILISQEHLIAVLLIRKHQLWLAVRQHQLLGLIDRAVRVLELLVEPLRIIFVVRVKQVEQLLFCSLLLFLKCG